MTQISSSEHQVLISSSPRYLTHEHLATSLLCYNTMHKHIWFSLNAGTSGHPSARKEKLTWFPPYCAFSSRLLRVWSSHHSQYCCGSSCKQHPQENGHWAPAAQHPQLGQGRAAGTNSHQPFQGWHLTEPQHKVRDGSTAEFHVAQAGKMKWQR